MKITQHFQDFKYNIQYHFWNEVNHKTSRTNKFNYKWRTHSN